MQQHSMTAMAARPTIAVVHGICADQLGAATPCSEYDIQTLINHLLFWGPSLEGAGRKSSVDPPAASERELDLVTQGEWKGRLEAQIEGIVIAWSEPNAWEGTTQMGGPMQLPASTIGGMILGELVVHGWDLARASGQHPTWDDQLLDFVFQDLQMTAKQGRDMGIYGDQVQVPNTAPVLDQILGLTGRDPAWSRTDG